MHLYRFINMKYLISIVLFLVFILSPLNAADLFFEGEVPTGLNKYSLQKEYFRIKNYLSPSSPDIQKPVRVIFFKKSESSHHGIRLPEWGGGGAIGVDTIVIPVGSVSPIMDFDCYRVCVHELVHIELARFYGNVRIPRWLHEGLAMALCGELNFDETIIVSRAVLTNSLLSFREIEKVNMFDQYKAGLSYAQSHIAVKFLIDTYGYDFIPELLITVKKDRYFQSASMELLGLTPDEIELLVKNHISSKYRYMFIFDSMLPWLFILFLAILGFFFTMYRNGKKRKLLEEQEAEDEIVKTDETSENQSI
jgi:hypothetical protein